MRTTLSLLAVVSLLALPCVAEARKPAKRSPADAKLDAAVAMVDAKAWDKAASELDRVYAASKDPRALYWLGRALQGGGKHAASMRAYQRYVREAGPSVDQARATDALGNVQLLSMQVGTLAVTAPEGCAITVDGADVGKTPLAEPYAVDAGAHTVAAKCGEQSTSKNVDVAEEARLTLDLTPPAAEKPLAAAPTPAPVAEPPPARSAAEPARSPSNSGTTTTVVGLGVATLLAGGAVFFGIEASKTASEFDAQKQTLGVDRDRLETLQKHTRVDVALAGGLGLAALGAAGVTLFVLRPSRRTETRVGVNGQGVSLAGSF